MLAPSDDYVNFTAIWREFHPHWGNWGEFAAINLWGITWRRPSPSIPTGNYFTPGVPQVCTRLSRYYEERHLNGRAWCLG